MRMACPHRTWLTGHASCTTRREAGFRQCGAVTQSSRSSSPADEINHNHNQSNDQNDMDETSQRVGGNEA